MNYKNHFNQTGLSIDYYNKNADKYIDNTFNLDMNNLYEPFLKEISKGSKILDAGCGPGRDSLYFISHGYEVTAFDGSLEFVKYATQKTGLPVMNVKFEELDFFEEFDAIWACASLLHIPNSSMDDVLIRLTKSLKPNGVIFVSFKYGENEEVRNGRLFNDFTENKLLSLVERNPDLSIISSWVSPDVRNDRNSEKWLNALLRK